MTDDIIETMASLPNMVNHLHLPFQAGSDRILELMKRNYTKAYYLNRIEKLKAKIKDITFSTDIISRFSHRNRRGLPAYFRCSTNR